MSHEAQRAPARLYAMQTGFAAYLRDPDTMPAPPGIEERRLRIYRELFYNNIESLLANNFPVIRKLLGDAPWHGLVRDFYREHHARTPLFPEIGREFLQYLGLRQQRGDGDPPFLQELAHYEWVELALSLDETDLSTIGHDRDGDLLAGVPLPSPLAWPLAYRWPVQRLGPGFRPDMPPEQPTFLLVLRDRDDAVRFKQIDGAGFALLQALHENIGRPDGQRRCGQELLLALAEQAAVRDRGEFARNGALLLEGLRERDAVLGTLPR